METLHKVIIDTNKVFSLKETLFSGQSFLWNNPDFKSNYYYFFSDSFIILLSQESPSSICVKFSGSPLVKSDIKNFISRYFTFDIDTNQVFSDHFKNRYPAVWQLIQPYLGVHVMRQDPFETMVTFMCAQGIGMGLIRRQVSMIAERYGRMIIVETERGIYSGHAFPTPDTLAAATVSELAVCTNNNRVRAANIIAMAQSFVSGELAMICAEAESCSLDKVRTSLCRHGGIGMKIADCIALFGLGRFDAFPIDTHVKQYLWEWFGIEAARKSLTPGNYRYLQERACSILGHSYAGYAGHILFHCWRKEIRKMKQF